MSFTHHILSTIDIKASDPTAPQGTRPDELMINWATLPAASTASLFLPTADADELLSAAVSLYGYQPFTWIDARTVGCRAQGVTYVPIRQAPGNIAGFIDVALPGTVHIGDKLTVAVSQITNAQATAPRRSDATSVPPALSSAAAGHHRPPRDHHRRGGLRAGPGDTGGHTTVVKWRKVAGTFQLGLKVASNSDTLPIVEQEFSLLLWIFAAMPLTSRWYPIFTRYITALAGQISGLGGDPGAIPPSATGTWPGGPGDHGTGHGPPGDKAHHLIGKIEGLIYDHFGDFEGFVLETDDGRTFRFFSREEHMQDVIRRAWAERLRLTITPEDDDQRRPHRVVLHPTFHAP